MGKVVHIIPVGFNKKGIIESIKSSGYPIHKAYLVLGRDKEISGEEHIHSIAKDIEKMLETLIDVEKVYVDKLDIYKSAIDILKVIKREMDEGNEILLNASDAAKTLCIACYIAAQISQSRIYLALPKYEGDKEVGIERILELSVPPLKRLGEDKINIIRVISKNGGEVESINQLIDLLEGKLDDQKKYMAQRARMSYHLNGLEEDGIVEMKREGKNVRIMLTELGKAYAVIFD
jgi:DNA-binding transcriptional ArsR family regulator